MFVGTSVCIWSFPSPSFVISKLKCYKHRLYLAAHRCLGIHTAAWLKGVLFALCDLSWTLQMEQLTSCAIFVIKTGTGIPGGKRGEGAYI